ncbi:hypothetical protein LCGC14_3021470 [marine sediment metagenome]|uniref:Uncharacterized protein n=1 Tax=marine sediment metagenome TaxID=412755 RepID=A0A0F8WV66_9ZZZZ
MSEIELRAIAKTIIKWLEEVDECMTCTAYIYDTRPKMIEIATFHMRHWKEKEMN